MDSPRQVISMCLAVATAVLSGFHPVSAADANGVAVCTAINVQYLSGIVSDGAGGAIVTWSDYRSATNYDIYAQRINSAGVPQWTPDGVALCTEVSDQTNLAIASDGAGGAIVTWSDHRSGTSYDIYAQRINSAGAPQWTADGVALCTAIGDQLVPAIALDGTGGAFVTWKDERSLPTTDDVYAQRVNAAGMALWPANGVLLRHETSPPGGSAVDNPAIIPNGAGGAIVAWQDYRPGIGGGRGIYAQAVNAAGVPQWTTNGVALQSGGVFPVPGPPHIVSDGAGGAIVGWDIGSSPNIDVRAARANSVGVRQWTVTVCSATNIQQSSSIAPDGAGGAIVTWHDFRSGTNYDIYAQRINSAGAPQWTADGVALSTEVSDQTTPAIASDGAGGAIVTWSDHRSGTSYDIYAQRINSVGAPQWTPDGVALCAAVNDQSYPAIASDGADGAIVAWSDNRTGDTDVYAQHVYSSGEVLAVPTVVGQGPTAARAWPDPFHDQVQMEFELSVASPVHMEVLDVGGRRVWASPTELMGSGRHVLTWNGQADNGTRQWDGIYFLRVRGPGVEASRTVLRLK